MTGARNSDSDKGVRERSSFLASVTRECGVEVPTLVEDADYLDLTLVNSIEQQLRMDNDCPPARRQAFATAVQQGVRSDSFRCFPQSMQYAVSDLW
jgi:hypothetical protein